MYDQMSLSKHDFFINASIGISGDAISLSLYKWAFAKHIKVVAFTLNIFDKHSLPMLYNIKIKITCSKTTIKKYDGS